MAREYLKETGSTYGSTFGIWVRRAPVLYEPRTGTDINHARLPPMEAMQDMQLAYRQPSMSEPEFATGASIYLLSVVVCSLLAAVGVVVVGSIVPFVGGAVAFGVIGLLAVLVAIQRGRPDLLSLLMALIAPFLVFLLIKVNGARFAQLFAGPAFALLKEYTIVLVNDARVGNGLGKEGVDGLTHGKALFVFAGDFLGAFFFTNTASGAFLRIDITGL